MNERVAIGGNPVRRGGGMMGPVLDAWRERPESRTHDLQQRLLKIWVEAEVTRLSGVRLREQLAAGEPGPEGSGMKLSFAKLNQELSGIEVELNRDLGYDDWSFRRSESVDFFGRGPGYRYLRAKGNSIEGGTSEILRNIVAERVLGLPSEPRVDKDVPWKDLPR
jgi:alkylation response protein AidB-like acyl-CoA dehydrogenase